jgi:hypothetical protein
MSNLENDTLLENLYEQFLEEGFEGAEAFWLAWNRLEEMGDEV